MMILCIFGNRVVTHWNSLPSHIVDADTA